MLFVFVVFSSRLSWSKVHVGPSLGFGIPEPILSLQRRRRLVRAFRDRDRDGLIVFLLDLVGVGKPARRRRGGRVELGLGHGGLRVRVSPG